MGKRAFRAYHSYYIIGILENLSYLFCGNYWHVLELLRSTPELPQTFS